MKCLFNFDVKNENQKSQRNNHEVIFHLYATRFGSFWGWQSYGECLIIICCGIKKTNITIQIKIDLETEIVTQRIIWREQIWT